MGEPGTTCRIKSFDPSKLILDSLKYPFGIATFFHTYADADSALADGVNIIDKEIAKTKTKVSAFRYTLCFFLADNIREPFVLD